LLALSVAVGVGVLTEVLEEKVDEVVGRKGGWDPDRTAVRHGHDDGEVTLGGRHVTHRLRLLLSATSYLTALARHSRPAGLSNVYAPWRPLDVDLKPIGYTYQLPEVAQ
jgi:hypothetical protein